MEAFKSKSAQLSSDARELRMFVPLEEAAARSPLLLMSCGLLVTEERSLDDPSLPFVSTLKNKTKLFTFAVKH